MSFSIATRDELWLYGRLVERRLAHGEAREDEHAIHASDLRDDALVAACDDAMERLRAFVVDDARTRLVAEASSDDALRTTIVITHGTRSIVTAPEHFQHDLALLRSASAGNGIADLALPCVWNSGSAAVLLHEAIGHPLEHEQPPVALPSWLTVDVPLRMRRATFKDVPLLRMTDVIVRQHGAPFTIPAHRVAIELVDGGAYDPLTELVTLRIAAANRIDEDGVHPLAPFAICETRERIARSITGAAGDPLRYPGVICSREGQELVVGSYAPLLLTELR